MRRALKLLAAVLLVGGVVACALAAGAALGDEAYYRAAAALERHPDHILFQAEYHAARARHVAYIVTAVASALTGVVGGATLFALAAVLERLERLEARLTR